MLVIMMWTIVRLLCNFVLYEVIVLLCCEYLLMMIDDNYGANHDDEFSDVVMKQWLWNNM